jgi:hypothetical protein
MIALIWFVLAVLASPFKSKSRLEAENAALRHQLIVLRRRMPAQRIHGELLKLGFSVAQSSVAKYMVKRRGPPSQGWKTFLRNHAPDIAAMDLLVVPTIGFKLLYGFVIVRIDRRDLVWINVTTNPTAEWIACSPSNIYSIAARAARKICGRRYKKTFATVSAQSGRLQNCRQMRSKLIAVLFRVARHSEPVCERTL